MQIADPDVDDVCAAGAVRLDALVARWCAGERAAFDIIVQETELDLRAFALSRTWSFDDADEAVQGAYVVAFERMGDYQGPGCFGSWLKGIVRLRLLELGRERQRRRHDDLDEVMGQVWEEAVANLGDDGLRPRLSALPTCLEHINGRAREMLERHHLEGVPLNELAQRYRRPRQTIARLLFQVRNALRDCIERKLTTGDAHA